MDMLSIDEDWAAEISDWETYLRAGHQAAGTRGIRTYHLRRLAHDHRGRGPYTLVFDDLVDWLAGHDWSPETRRSYRASLRRFYAWAHAGGRCATNPAYELPTIKVPRGLPRPAPADVVVTALDEAPVRERLMVLILVETGMRRAELAALRTDDLVADLVGYSLRIKGKGGRERSVPLTDELARILRLCPEGWVFPSTRGGHLTPAHVGRLVSGVLGDRWTAHSLRHRYASIAYALERDLRAVQELLGHARPETTSVYTLVPDGAMRRAAMAAARAHRTAAA